MKKYACIVFAATFVLALFMFTTPESRAEVPIAENLTMSGLVDVQARSVSSTDAYLGDSSDIRVYTLTLGVDAKVNDNVDGHISFLYEDQDLDRASTGAFAVDEGTITIKPSENVPLSVTAGKMYVPFGNFTTNMISYPQTQELVETNEVVVQVGFEAQGFSGSVYAFNGDTREASSTDDTIEHYGANVGYVMEMDNMNLDVGVSYISSIGDSDNIGGSLTDAEALDSYVAGYSAYAIFEMAPFTVIAEYVAAADDFKVGELAYGPDTDRKGAQPTALNIELAFGFEVAGKETTVAVGYQNTSEAREVESDVQFRPDNSILACVAMTLYENTRLAVEYAQHNDYGDSDGGTDDSASIVTFQLAVEF